MNVQSLPIELHSQIFDHLDHSSLLTLLLVSSDFNREAERRLYHAITLVARKEQRVKVLGQLSQVDRVGVYVHTLDLGNFGDASSDNLKCIVASYANMPNLRFLSLPRSFDPSIIPPPTVPFRLFSFHIRPSGDSIDQLIAVQIFLESQNDMVEFLTFQTKIRPISPNALPNLRIVHAYPEVLVALVPGRAVTHLYLYVQQHDSVPERMDARALKSLSLADIQTLDFFQMYLPALEYLELGIVRSPRCNYTLKPDSL